MLLNAVLCVWNEEDIIASTVRHLFAQGCSQVFIVDNGSTDRSVDLAAGAGATLAGSFVSAYFDEMEKIAHLNTVVRNYNGQSPEERIWWLYADADEFPHIAGSSSSLREYLEGLDSSVRALQGFLFNHIPTHAPYYVPGYHPADFQPLCAKTNISKIPLLRYDTNKPHLYSAAGAHTADTGGELIPVMKNILTIHHFNYRSPEHSIPRLARLTAKRSDGTSRLDRADHKTQSLARTSDVQSDYHARALQAKRIYTQHKYLPLMTDYLPYDYTHIKRWYDRKESLCRHSPLSAALCDYFHKDYASASAKFRELRHSMPGDPAMDMLLTIKIAQCFHAMRDEVGAAAMLQPLLACRDADIRAYAARVMEMMGETQGEGWETLRYGAPGDDAEVSVQHYFGKFDKQYFVEAMS